MLRSESAPEQLRDRLHQQLRKTVLEQSRSPCSAAEGTSVEVRSTRIERQQR